MKLSGKDFFKLIGAGASASGIIAASKGSELEVKTSELAEPSIDNCGLFEVVAKDEFDRQRFAGEIPANVDFFTRAIGCNGTGIADTSMQQIARFPAPTTVAIKKIRMYVEGNRSLLSKLYDSFVELQVLNKIYLSIPGIMMVRFRRWEPYQGEIPIKEGYAVMVPMGGYFKVNMRRENPIKFRGEATITMVLETVQARAIQ